MNFNTINTHNAQSSNTSEDRKLGEKSAVLLKREFNETKESRNVGIILKFEGVGDKDVYNPTPPTFIDGELVIAARVEPRIYDPKVDRSEVCFFHQKNEDTWVKIENAASLLLEDPFITNRDNEIIVGGVRVSTVAGKNRKKEVAWNTVFCKGESINSLKEFAVGPKKMKDIRVIKLEKGGFGVFTRPQDIVESKVEGKLEQKDYGRGKIAYIEIDNLEELNDSDLLLRAKVIPDLFTSHEDPKNILNEWGGANQLHQLKNGLIGVIGHTAHYDEQENKHYYATSFVYDPEKGEVVSPMKIIATRDNFPPGETKKDNLRDVIFSGGIYQRDGRFYFYAGLSDTQAGELEIEDPFKVCR